MEILSGIFVVIAIFVVIGLLSHLDQKRYEREQNDIKLVRQINQSFSDHHNWKTLRMFDALSAGMTVKYIDVSANSVILQTPDGLVEAKVNRQNLPHLLLELKLSQDSVFKHKDLYINLDMDTQEVIIDNIDYSK